jgi:hypothetical protein
MATYDINGFTYRSPRELTEAELMDLGNNLKASGALDPEARKQEITSREQLKTNPGLMDAYRRYYKRIEGKEFQGTSDELVDSYTQQMRDWNLNTGSLMALSGRLAGNSFDEKERQAIAVMWDTWDRTVPFYASKDAKWQGLGQSAYSIISDPTNLIGLVSMGTGTAAGVASREAAKLGVRQLIKQFAVQGAKSGAIQGAIDGAVTNTLEQSSKTNLGLQREFSVGQLAGATALGAGGGAILGGALGAGQGALKGKLGQAVDVPTEKIADDLADPGLPNAPKTMDQANTARTMDDANQTLSAAEKFAQEYNDPAVVGARRAEARNSFLDGVADSTRRAFEKEGDLGKTVSFEEAKTRSGALLDKIGVTDYADLSDVVNKLEGSFNSGKIEVTDLSTLTATTIGVETHAFRKFQEAVANNSPDTIKLFETYEKATRLASHLSNQQARSTAFQYKRMRDLLDPLTYAEAVDLAAKSPTGMEAKTFQDLINDRLKRGINVGIGTLNEFWVHNILGSVKTLTVNTLGGLSVALTEPGSRVLGGLLQGDLNMTKGALREWATMASTIHQSMLYSLKSFYHSKTFIDGRVTNELAERGQDIFIGDRDLPLHEILQPWKFGWMNTLGNANRFIGKRGMQATDELLKQMGFRSRVVGLAIEDNLAKGMSYPDAVKQARVDAAKALEDQLDAVAQGKMVDNPLAQRAIEYSRYTTFQNDLSNDVIGNFGKTVSKFRNSHPVFTQIMPFIRTPFNIMDFVAERTPVIQNFTSRLRDKIAAGGREAAEAEAAIHISTMVMASATLLAFTDMMEGPGPLQPGSAVKVDKGKSMVARGAGIQPYSVIIDSETGERVQINRLDPYARQFTLMAKVKDIYKYGTKADQDAVLSGLVAAFAVNFAEMSSLSGIKEALEIFQSDKSLGQAVGRKAGSFVPYFRLMNDVFGDDYKAAYSIVDEIHKNIPIVNSNMDVRRNPIFGTPIQRNDTLGFPMSPLPVDKQSYDDVDKELVRLNIGMLPPEAKLFDGRIDLTKIKHPNGRSAYDRYQELVGLVKAPNGKTLYESMRDVIKDPRYLSLLTDPESEVGVYEQGGKATQLKKVVREYRKLALNYLATEEMPKLKDQMNAAYRSNKASNSVPAQRKLEALLDGEKNQE